MPKPSKPSQVALADDQLLLEPSLIALRRVMDQQEATLEQQTVSLHLSPDTARSDPASPTVRLRGVGGSPKDGGCAGGIGHRAADAVSEEAVAAIFPPHLPRQLFLSTPAARCHHSCC